MDRCVWRHSLKAWLAAFVILTLTAPVFAGSEQEPPPPKLNILIIEGEGAINNVRLRTAREPIVQVEDENHKPVAGAIVLFTLPERGAGGAFAQGAKTFSTTTDAQGRAVAQGFQPGTATGRYQIRVSASSRGSTANATISQRNVRPGLSTMTKVLIASAVVAGVIIGVVVSKSGGGGTTPTVITPGTPSVGGR